MLRRFLIVLAVLILTGAMVGCRQSRKPSHSAQVLGSDIRNMGRDFETVLGLNRTGIYSRYDSPCYIDGH